jgi:RND superfamily putative drug exporter
LECRALEDGDLLGDWNWYLPRWLEWLPRLNVEPELHEEIPQAPPVPAP